MLLAGMSRHLHQALAAAPQFEAMADPALSCVLVSAASTLVESAACRQDQALALAGALPLQRSRRHAAPTDRACLRLHRDHGVKAEAASRLKVRARV